MLNNKLHSIIECAPCTCNESDNIIRDLRGRCVKVDVPLGHERLANKLNVRPTRSSLINGEKSDEDQLVIRALFLAKCPMEECVRGTSYTYTE